MLHPSVRRIEYNRSRWLVCAQGLLQSVDSFIRFVGLAAGNGGGIDIIDTSDAVLLEF